MDRNTVLRAVADRAHALANDGESAPDYRWMGQYIDAAAKRYDVQLTHTEQAHVATLVRSQP